MAEFYLAASASGLWDIVEKSLAGSVNCGLKLSEQDNNPSEPNKALYCQASHTHTDFDRATADRKLTKKDSIKCPFSSFSFLDK